MCGIAGIISLDNNNQKSRLARMAESIKHRGPDDLNIITRGKVSFIHNRLSIIGLENGAQPLYDKQHDIYLIANGEIYNFVELRKSLESKGYIFKTESDCEVILHVYAHEGVNGIKQLRGMFAFALYDIKNNKVLIVRDRMGEKPLYYWKKNSELVFSSELQGILAAQKEIPSIDHQAIVDFFRYQYIPEPRTLFKSIKKIPRSSIMTVDLNDLEIKIASYWNPWDEENISRTPFEELKQSYNESLRISSRSDVPIAISLSGGLDSSLIAASLANASTQEITAISLGYEGYPENDERNLARNLSNLLNISFVDIELSNKNIPESFIDVCRRRDEPVGDISGINYNAIMRECNKRGIKVIFSGQGADELFWGYDWVRLAAKNNSENNLFSKIFSKNKEYEMFELQPFSQWCLNNEHWMFPFIDDVTIDSPTKTYGKLTGNSDIDVMRLICDFYLLGNGVSQAERLSMSHSVECRLPFLDHVFVENAIGFQLGQKYYNKEPKVVLKNISKNILPKEIISRKKRGFTPPVKIWQDNIRSELADDFREGILAESGLLSKNAVMRLSKEVLQDQIESTPSRLAYTLEFTLRKHLQ
tara:strand:- start:879 stop:2648 length:1770 start_codon:yes stop_codon:yes gene_type:complete